MKRIFALLISLVILLSTSTSTWAVDIDDDLASELDATYNNAYKKLVLEDGRKIQSYNKTEDEYRSVSDIPLQSENYEYTKNILENLGVGDVFINKLSNETLEKYSNAKNIISVTTYSKTDVDGNAVILDEKTALSEVTAIKQAIELQSIENTVSSRAIVPVDPGFGGGSYPRYYGDYTDEYMKINFVIAELGDGYYHYSMDAEWLTEPIYRRNDSIGICVMNNTIINNTRSGWRSYEEWYAEYGIEIYEEKVYNFTSSDFENCIEGSWNGSGVAFNLEDDNEIVKHKNFEFHYEFEAVITQPDDSLYFNATAAYSHLQIGIDWDPSLSISTNGVDTTIGVDLVGYTNRRVAQLEEPIHYVPE